MVPILHKILYSQLKAIYFDNHHSQSRTMCKKVEAQPGDGIRSLKTSLFFRTVNYELYVKPNLVIMGIGIVAFIGCTGYIAYMKSKYNDLGLYSAVKEDGTEQLLKKKSKWD